MKLILFVDCIVFLFVGGSSIRNHHAANASEVDNGPRRLYAEFERKYASEWEDEEALDNWLNSLNQREVEYYLTMLDEGYGDEVIDRFKADREYMNNYDYYNDYGSYRYVDYGEYALMDGDSEDDTPPPQPPCDNTPRTSDYWKNEYARRINSAQASVKDMTLIRMGVMGSGKTTAVNLYLDAHAKEFKAKAAQFPLIDLDEMVTHSKVYLAMNCDDRKQRREDVSAEAWWRGQVDIDGYATSTYIQLTARKQRQTFSVESTGGRIVSVLALKDIIQKGNCKAFGKACFYKGPDLGALPYRVFVVSPFVPFYELKERVETRAEKEGRSVELSELRNNFFAYVPNILKLMPEMEFYLVSNLVPYKTAPLPLAKSLGGKICKAAEFEAAAVGSKIVENKAKYTHKDDLRILKMELALFKQLSTLPPCA